MKIWKPLRDNVLLYSFLSHQHLNLSDWTHMLASDKCKKGSEILRKAQVFIKITDSPFLKESNVSGETKLTKS